jgi:phosphoesterase RecJ-like protein
MSNVRPIGLSELCDLLLSIENPLVVMHIRPDGDTVGSAAALAEIFKELGKNAPYTCADEIPERLQFLVEGIERAEHPESYGAVTVDVPSPMQLGGLLEKLNVVCSIDHHGRSTPFAPHYTLGDISSAGEGMYLVAEELIRRGVLKMTKRIAERLYAAISSDTGRFAYASATDETYRIAASLIGMGIDHAEINRRLFASKSLEEIRAEGFVGERVRNAKGGIIAYAVISKAERDAADIPFHAFETAIDIVRQLRGSSLAFIVKETDKGEFKASLRSVDLDVSEIASRHSGGGHIRAAGCTVSAGSAEEAASILIDELTRALSA